MTEYVPEYLDTAIDLAHKLPPGDLDRIAAINEVERIYRSIGNNVDSEKWIRVALDEMRVRLAPSLSATPEQTHIPWSLSESIYTGLGFLELEKGATTEAIEWFERAQQVTENAPEQKPGDKQVKTTSMLFNYLDLGRAHCQANNVDTAHNYLDQLKQACEKQYNPRAMKPCRTDPPC